MALKNLIYFLVIGAGGIAPLSYFIDKGLRKSEKKTELADERAWDCQIKKFDKQHLENIIPNSPFFQIIHCYKEQEYDWQILVPKSFIQSIKLDESKSFNLITGSKSDNLKVMKITQGETPLLKDWLLLKKSNSHSVRGGQGEDQRYSQLFEFQILNYLGKGEKSWVFE
ncbi:hypothetical protein WEN_01300 [Mycoplasma wenyonii str. Massachusetts]|uniref:Uncharacterized protein n=1 Tax=Mycoplasma wenyonii (strain Massachusetts) TaxID=1197325 RepID=I6YLA2_MYCWM|nr:hypothetical protein [Mycoplasma wenyonii]AFN65059.1 hypothetical protein WEN_01300 [Mycoplasma wenyonii str. Massachusetts]